jgi:hypothetical protein
MGRTDIQERGRQGEGVMPKEGRGPADDIF